MSFFSELKRRSVIRVAIAYAAGAWLIIEVVATIFPLLDFPERWAPVITVALLAGFPVAVILAWIFQLTPEGVVVDHDTEVPAEFSRIAGRKLDFMIIGALSLALVFVVIDQYVIDRQPAFDGGQRSIAVLPFRNRSTLADDQFFVDGIHDDILLQLSKISAMEKVVSRTSVEAYRGSAKSTPEIGEELGVTTILEGGVQRAGDRVRINVQLVDAVNDRNLWSGNYDRDLTAENVFAIQSEIAVAIANSLQATLTEDEEIRLSNVPTDNLTALENYFLGRNSMRKRTATSLDMAKTHFERAINIDPEFALAYVGLAQVYDMRRYHAETSWEEELPIARSMVEKALALDSNLADAFVASAGLYLAIDDDQARAELDKALELDPNNAGALIQYCDLLNSFIGQPSAALPYCERALALDPLSVEVNHQLSYVFDGLGRYEDARNLLQRVLELDSEYSIAYADLGWHFLLSQGRADEAIRWFRKTVDLNPSGPMAISWIAHAYLDLGEIELASFWANRSLDVAPSDNDSLYIMALLNLYRGNDVAAEEYARQLLASEPSRGYPLAVVKDALLARGQPEATQALYAHHHPDLIEAKDSPVTAYNLRATLDTAHVLLLNEQEPRAFELLDRIESYIQDKPRLSGSTGFDLTDVQIHALRGDTELALKALREAIDEGFQSGWWWYLLHNSITASLRDIPEFKQIVAEFEARAPAQLANLQTWEETGELAPIPDLADR